MNQNKATRRKFILIVDRLNAKRKDRGKNLNPVETEIEVLSGHLFEEIAIQSSPTTGKNLALQSLELEGVVLTCIPENVKQVSDHESDVLLALTNSRDRMKVFRDKAWLKEGVMIKEGTDVDYLYNVNSEPRLIPAKVRYKGSVYGFGKGTMFGIELIGYSGKGKCDGSLGKKRYFQCDPECGLFVPISRIRMVRNSYSSSLDYPRLCADKILDEKSAVRAVSEQPPLKINDRVVWLSDTGPEYGVVRWIGKLPDVGQDWTVGVEFDNPVGTGTGKYKDQQLFVTPLNHASLIPIMGLMRARDWCPDEAGNTITNHSIRGGPGDNWQQPEAMSPTIAETANTRVQQLDLPGDQQSNLNKLVTRGNHLPGVENDSSNDYIDRITADLGVISNWIGSHDNQEVLNPLYKSEDDEYTGSNFHHINNYHLIKNCESELGHDLEVGSVVEVPVQSKPTYGVIRWIGTLHGKSKKIAGLEMEEETSAGTDGTFDGKQYFECPPKKAFFVYLSSCKKDGRFSNNALEKMSAAFGSQESPVIPGHVAPPNIVDNIQAICGKNRGIQGHHNSCYLDATLFSMFAFTSVFDSLLNRPAMPSDLTQYEQVQSVLREEIVNPLRQNFYVRADRIMKLRTLLDKLSSVTGLTTEEKDPEEFLNSLLQQILKAEPFLKLSSGQEAYFYQLFVEKDEGTVLPRVQQLFEQSFLASDIKLKEIPPCLIIQMPRFGKQYKMYPRIVPSLKLDITDVLENSPRQCNICGTLAEYECKDCFRHFGEGLESIAFCENCVKQSHGHTRRSKHIYRKIGVPEEFRLFYDKDTKFPKNFMELFAVVCIETSHYVAFVKSGSGPDAPWCFFDSMADRKGEQNGYNIPELVACPDLVGWLSEEGCHLILNAQDDKQLPEHARRLLSDAYMCMYQSTEVMMYR